ncbi:4-hydroxybenzoyl-CoA reductase subunit beta [Planctomycetes bacterium Poly30]|uniref:4-hydroxybenzoyl-CoA reductase subunit beta n=1 Tax=Saltatorellus ferox TaxID=2528018 RepID=A0A518ETW4_9BACT|nr:4-hydroxybenzoyl-CoA reductase subunit beta [Planctomycetes bacterium Poly30]
MQPFDLKTPKTLDEAIAELPQERSRTAPQVIAGGQDILTVMKDDIAAPSALVEIGGLDLGGIETAADGSLQMGALVTIQEIADDGRIAERFPALADAAKSIASPQIRSHATIGGNLNQKPRCPYYRHSAVSCFKKGGNVCLAEFGFNKYAAILGGGPSYFSHPSDMATALMLYGAVVTAQGPRGVREIALSNYYLLPDMALDRESVLESDEIITKITVPAPRAGLRSTYMKFKERASYDFALGAVAVSLMLDGNTIQEASVVLGGVAPTPWPSPEAAQALIGKEMGPNAWNEAGEAAMAEAVPLEHNGYKVHLMKGVLYRALEQLA